MEIEIYGDYIKVSQFLKKVGIIDTGGKTKFFIKTNKILINNKESEGRNSKIKVGDIVWIDDNVYKIVFLKNKVNE